MYVTNFRVETSTSRVFFSKIYFTSTSRCLHHLGTDIRGLPRQHPYEAVGDTWTMLTTNSNNKFLDIEGTN